MTFEERKALVRGYLGKTVRIVIDRPLGSAHPSYEKTIYPINYGYVPNVMGSDGEELDVYLMGVDEPVQEFRGRIIGIVHRKNDVEDKLVGAPEGVTFTADEMMQGVLFQEKYYDSYVETETGELGLQK